MVIAHVPSPKIAGLHGRWGLRYRVSNINSSFLAKFRFPAREYMRRCNAVENIHIHKVIGPWDRVIFVPETEAIISKVPLACQITKASNSSHFHIPLMFLFFTFPAMQYRISFSFFHTFSHLRNLKQCVQRGDTTRTATCLVRSAKLSPVQRG